MTSSSLSLDEFDIRESFDALDDEKLGLISVDKFYTMYLGLGYKPQLTIDALKDKFPSMLHAQTITVETALHILSKFTRDRQDELNACYGLVDHDKKGYISPQDIERLSTIVGEPMSLSEAQTLLEQSAIPSTGDYEPTSAPVTILRQGDFQRIFNPPESMPPSF